MTICWPLLILMYYKQSSSMALTLTFKKHNKPQIYIRAYCQGKRKTKKNVFFSAATFIFFKVIHILEKRRKVQCIYCIDFIVSSHQQCVCALFLKFTVLLCIHTYHYMLLCAMLLSVTAFFILCNLRFIGNSLQDLRVSIHAITVLPFIYSTRIECQRKHFHKFSIYWYRAYRYFSMYFET